jgi:hypothetical protein
LRGSVIGYHVVRIGFTRKMVTRNMLRRNRLRRNRLAAVLPFLALSVVAIGPACAEDPAWTIVLHPKDFVVGSALSGLKTRHQWVDQFDASGNFEVAVKRAAVAIASPQCRMNYLIVKIPFYYPENPKQASLSERRAVYDSLVALQTGGSGSVSMRVEAPLGLARGSGSRTELTSCSLFVALPLSVQSSTR